MKRAIYVLIVIGGLVLSVLIFIKPLMISLGRQQFKKIFINSSITIKDCDFNFLGLLRLSGIEIKKEPIYDFKVKELNIQYNLPSIIRGNISKVSLKDTRIAVNLPDSSIRDISKHLGLESKGIFRVASLELTNLNLDLNSNDLILKADISSGLNVINQLINYFDLKISSLKSSGFQIENASLKISQTLPSGLLFIERINRDKLKVENIESRAGLDNKFLFLDSLSAGLLGGNIRGDIKIKIDKNPQYLINLKFTDLDLDALVNDFNLKEKVEVSGRLNGAVALKGDGLNIDVLNGDFTTAEAGGVLTIKDTNYLGKIARNSNQSLDIIVESFKNYHYNTGVMKLSKDKGNLVLDVALYGEAGRRNLTVMVHDFKLKKEE